MLDSAAFARRYRIRELPDLGVPEGAVSYWGEIGRSWLPHPVDELFGAGGVQGYLFAGPSGTGKYTTAMQLAGVLLNRGWKVYYLTGNVFDSLDSADREAAFEELLGAQEAASGENTGHVVILHFPEDAAHKKKLQLALVSAMETAESLECSTLLFVVTGKASCIREQLLRKLTYCEFRLPDSKERENYLRTAFESIFRYTKNGGAAAEKKGRDKLVAATEGLSYTQLRQLVVSSLLLVKRHTIDRIGYDPEKVREEMRKAEFFFLEEEELLGLADHIRLTAKESEVTVKTVQVAANTSPAAANGPGTARQRPAFGPGTDLQKAYERATKVKDMLSEMGV